MAEYKLFNTPHSHDAEFYKNREAVDHIEQDFHKQRMIQAKEVVEYFIRAGFTSVTDIGCGTGGLLGALKGQPATMWGYDLCPKAVEYGQENYDVDIQVVDFVNEPIAFGEVVIMTEVLEHLVDPDALLRRAAVADARRIVASSPVDETPQQHYEHHLWAWDMAGYKQLFERNGWEVLQHRRIDWCQFLVAKRGI